MFASDYFYKYSWPLNKTMQGSVRDVNPTLSQKFTYNYIWPASSDSLKNGGLNCLGPLTKSAYTNMLQWNTWYLGG